MKLYEKKCPNCGAKLEFSIKDREVKCDYCKSSFEISHDAEKEDDDYVASDFVLSKVAKTIQMTSIITFIIAFIFIFGIAGTIIYSVAKEFKKESSDSSIKDEFNNIEKEIEKNIEDIKEKNKTKSLTFDDFTSEDNEGIREVSLSVVKKWIGTSRSYNQSEPVYVGSYLVNNKNYNSSTLYDLYKTTFQSGSNIVDIYTGVSYSGLKLSNDKVQGKYDGFVQGEFVHLDNSNDTTYGYKSIREFYNSVVKPDNENYEVLKNNDELYIN